MQHHPIRHDFDAGISIEGIKRLVDGCVRLNDAIAAVGGCEPVKRRRHVGIVQCGAVGMRRDQRDVAEERCHRPKVRCDLCAVGGTPGTRVRQQLLRRLELATGIAACGNLRQDVLF